MAVEEELVARLVPELPTLLGVPQQRVRQAVQRAQLSLEPQAADVDDDPLAALQLAVVVARQVLGAGGGQVLGGGGHVRLAVRE